MKRVKILNSEGKEVLLNAHEQRVADYIQRQVNALGYEVDITTLTTIIARVTEQKFFEVAPADYLPIRVGQGAWSSNLLTYKTFNLGDDFSTGIMNTGSNSARMAQADTAVEAIPAYVFNWGKQVGWSIMDLQMAAKSGNWDLVSSKEKARKKNWDLGIQQVAFLGLTSANSPAGKCLGLLNQPSITTNTTLITQAISSMTPAQLKTFLANLVNTYRANSNRTAWPTAFIIPESDYLGLASPASSDFPIRSTLSLLEETLQIMTKNKSFKVLPLAYADAANNPMAKQVYMLLNQDEESIRMDIPVDYTNTLANSFDNFNFQNVGYGQFTGVVPYRSQEAIYFTY